LEKLPIFVKAGAIIPMQPEMNFFGEKPVDPVTLDIYPSGYSAFKIYEDDGLSLDYQKGVFAQTIIKCTDNSKSVTVEILGSTGQYHLNDRNYTLRIHLDKKPISVISGDSLLSNWTFDETNSTLEVTIAKKADEKISVMLNK
jgi:alpha-glucosidase (family GH31 glycosyl hydrolase)